MIVGIIFVILGFCLTSIDCLGVTVSSPSIPLVTLEIYQQSLKDVIATVSKKIGYVIKIDERLSAELISGKYIEVPVESFFYRILRNQNVSIISNDQEKILIVKILGNKPRKYYVTGIDKSNASKTGLLTMQKFRKLQYEQAKGYQEYLVNPDSVDSIMGITLSSLHNTLESQAKDYYVYLNNPNSIDSISGFSLSEMHKAKEYQIKKYKEFLDNPDSIDSLTGHALSALHKARQHQLIEYKRYLNNSDNIDSVLGLNLSEINGNTERQLKEYKEYLNNPNSVDSKLTL